MATLDRLGKRTQQLNKIMHTNISRQINWVARLVREQENARNDLNQFLEGRQTLDAMELADLRRISSRLLWPDILAIWPLGCQVRQHRIDDPQILADFRTRMAFDRQYGWLIDPVRPIASLIAQPAGAAGVAAGRRRA